MSQEQLAHLADVSVRHLSYVETGRSVPSRELVIDIANSLGVRNVGLFFEAAGYVAPYEDQVSDEALASFKTDVRRLVDAQPLPALVHDRFGTIVHAISLLRRALRDLTGEAPLDGPASGHRVLELVRPLLSNWREVAGLYRRRLFHELVRGGADLVDELLEQLYASLGGEADDGVPPELLTPLLFQHGERRLSFEMTTTTLGVPQDILLRNYRLLVLLPADASTTAWLEGLSR